jgi:CRISPR/Cas system-associated exonuclease Cas4 (RecB family)
MAKIPKRGDPTIDALKKKIYENQFDEKPRDYLGASLIGNPCARQIWYSFNNYPREPFSAETLMRFEDGHRTEDLTAERLRSIEGITLWTHKEDGSQYGFSAFNGKFKGHCDGVIQGLKQAPSSIHVWECKASEYKKYNEFTKVKAKHGDKDTLKNWNENYYIQANLYMHFLQIDRHYTTVAYAGGRNYQSCRTDYDPVVAEMAIDKAEKIINTKEPPKKISEKPDFYICKWCDYRKVCHGTDI